MMTRFLESHESEMKQLVDTYQQCVADFEALQRLMLQFHGHLVDLRDSTQRIADRRIADVGNIAKIRAFVQDIKRLMQRY